MAMRLGQVVPWGRSRKEYERMFDLTPEDLSGRVLDCGGGPASFTSEVCASGGCAVAVDPVYKYSGPEIRARFEGTVDSILAQVRSTPEDWVWSYHRDPDHLLENRRAALEGFLGDYDRGRIEGRYVEAELPVLPFGRDSFDLAVCSHFLFLYSKLLPLEFHVEAVRELCRVAGEVRIFPLLTLAREPSPHLSPVRAVLEPDGWHSQVIPVDYELQRGGNQMLKVSRRGAETRRE